MKGSMLKRALRKIFAALWCLMSVAALVSALSPQEEAAALGLIAEFFAAYQRRDVDRLMALWSTDSQETAQNKDSVLKSLVSEKLEWESYSVDGMKLDGDSGSVRLVLRS